MKHNQAKYFVGYVTIIIKGKHIEEVLQAFIDLGYPIWDITLQDGACYATIYRHHFPYLERLVLNKKVTIDKVKSKGGTIFLQNIFQKKQWILSLFICIVLLFLLGNTAWKVEINGVSVHLEDEMKKTLSESGLYQGAWTYNLTSLDQLEDRLLNDVPELLYVGIQKSGTTYQIEAIEKKLEKEITQPNSNQLIAGKSGIIQKMDVKSGNPVVGRNDFVEKGDLLVTNEVGISEETEEEQDEAVKKIPVEGKVFANTWYDIEVTASLEPNFDKLTGEKTTRYQLQLDDKSLPIWGFGRSPYKQNVINEDVKSLQLWKWKLPIDLIEQNIYEYESDPLKRSEEETKERVIEYVINHLQIKLGQDIQILKYYVLHESVESGKVNMNIYFSLLENIATSK